MYMELLIKPRYQCFWYMQHLKLPYTTAHIKVVSPTKKEILKTMQTKLISIEYTCNITCMESQNLKSLYC